MNLGECFILEVCLRYTSVARWGPSSRKAPGCMLPLCLARGLKGDVSQGVHRRGNGMREGD